MRKLNIVAGLIMWSCVICRHRCCLNIITHFYSNFQCKKKLIKAGRYMVPTMNIFTLNFIVTSYSN